MCGIVCNNWNPNLCANTGNFRILISFVCGPRRRFVRTGSNSGCQLPFFYFFSDSIRKASPPASEVVELLLPPAGGAAPAESRRRFETGSWKIVPASYLLSLSGKEPLAECRTLVDAGVLLTLYGTEEELLRAETFDKYPGLV